MVVLTQFPQECLDGMKMMIVGKALCTGQAAMVLVGVDPIIVSGRDKTGNSHPQPLLARLTSWK